MADGIDYKTLHEKYTRFKVVQGDQLEEATKGAWELVGETAPSIGPFHCSSGFLMGLTRENTVAEDQQTIEQLRHQSKSVQAAHEAYVQGRRTAGDARNKLLWEAIELINSMRRYADANARRQSGRDAVGDAAERAVKLLREAATK